MKACFGNYKFNTDACMSCEFAQDCLSASPKKKKTEIHEAEIQEYIINNNLTLEQKIRLENRQDIKKLISDVSEVKTMTKFNWLAQQTINKKLQEQFDNCPARKIVEDAEATVRTTKRVRYFILLILGIIGGMGGWELLQYLKGL